MSEEPTLSHRDIIARDTFTIAERYVFLLLLAAALATFWAGDPRSTWILSGLLIAGGLSIVTLKTHELTHIYHVELLWPKFWLLSAPVWVLLLQFSLGLLQSPIQTIELDEKVWLQLTPTNQWMPTTTNRGFALLTFPGFAALYLIALTLFIVPKSRAFFERTLPWLCLSAALVGVFGILQKSLDLSKPLFTEGTGQLDFFAFFPYDGHWAAFATLWCAGCISMSLSTALLQDTDHYLQSKGPWFLAAASMLGLSGFWLEARWPAAILLITYASLMFFVAIHFLSRSKDVDRKLIAATCVGVSLATFVASINKIFAQSGNGQELIELRKAGFAMFQDQPLFGWGLDAFAQIAPYYVSDSTLPLRYERAGSDWIQLLAELGLFGSGVLLALVLVLLVRYIRGRHEFHLTNYLLFGCGSVLALAAVDTPFMSPAVFFSFWILLFSAFRWADLSRNRVDEVDARVIVVSDASERRVPVFKGEYNEKHK